MENEISKRVHALTNCLQVVLSLSELGETKRALEQLQTCIKQVIKLQGLVRIQDEKHERGDADAH